MEEKMKNFEKLLTEAVDEGLKTLGESGKQAILFHLERNFSVKKDDIPKKPEAFAEGLERIFGVGATVIQKIILQNLYFKLGLKYEDKKNYTFADYLNDAKQVREDIEAQSAIELSSSSQP